MQFVVATDGSTRSDETLDYAIDVAEGMGASLTVVHAVDPNVYEVQSGEPIAELSDAEQRLVIEDIEDAEERGRQVLDDAAAAAERRGFEVGTELLYGDAVEAISTYAEEHDCDGIFVGHRHLSKDHERAVGSVAKGLIDRAPFPVTIVR